MSKFAFIVIFAAILTAFGWTSGVATAARPVALTKFLNDMDRSICRKFKVTCKAHAKPRAVKREKPTSDAQKTTDAPASPAKRETIATKSIQEPPIPVQKPALVPKAAASAPVKTAGNAPIPIQKPALAPKAVASASIKAAGKPSISTQRPVIAQEQDELAPLPIPRAKPPKLQQQAVLIPHVLPKETLPSDDDDKCLQKLRAAGTVFTIPTVNVDNEKCYVQNPVNLHSVKAQKNLINLPEGPLLNCKFALQFSKWLSESGAPILAAQLGTPLEKISTGPGFECRGRNGDGSAKISEHGFGNAIDITTLRMHGGKVINVLDAIDPNAESYAILHGLRASACGYFTTVLGPGSNVAHEKHFHFDLGVHGKSGNYRICE